MRQKFSLLCAILAVSFALAAPLAAQSKKSMADAAPKVTSPKEFFGHDIAADYEMVNYDQAEAYWKKLASESDRMKMVDIGPTEEGRHQWMLIITAPANMKNLDHYKEISQKLAHAENLTDDQAHQMARDGKAVVWIDGGLHASESVGFEQLVEMSYEMVSGTDPEMMRLLNDDITLLVAANPDGSDFVAKWYMRESDPSKRNGNNLPKLYNKYIGHDDNRDSYMSNMNETTNMNHQLFIEWFPQIMYNHHQTGPTGAVIFMPPFRDPFNYNFDPLVPLGIEAVGTAMHERLVEHNMGGSAMRSGSNYSTWWDGGLRTTVYFHNMIGILTEIIGAPTPIDIALAPDKQLPTGDWPMPIAPTTGTTKWHYRQSVDYEMQNNRAILDYASRNRETLLYNLYLMGKNSIQRGSQDHWTITPKRIEALREAGAAEEGASGGGGGRGGRGGRGGAAAQGGDAAAAVMLPGGIGLPVVPSDLYDKVLHDPKFRDPRVFIVTADQPDFPTATKFINSLLKNGIEVWKASSSFQAGGKSYPAGSFVVKCDQAARPFVLDMFQPQDHPNDFRYPGGPPIPPYDIAGWTLAYQMGVQFDRLYDDVTGPFARVPQQVQAMPAAQVSGASGAAGYLISHAVNNSFIVVNRLLKANCDVYWLKSAQQGAGTIYVPATASSTPIVQKGAQELGVAATGVSSAPSGAAMKIKPVRIALYDQYGGLMPTGWVRWLFEQFEFPYTMVYPPDLDAGNLKNKFDVIVFNDGAYRNAAFGGRGGGGGFGGGRGPDPQTTPEPYKNWIGRISNETTIPALKQFVDAGGSVVTVGSSTSLAMALGVPIANYLTEMGADGQEHPLPGEKFYIPGSLMRVTIDNTTPLAYGMPSTADVDFDSSPVFRLVPQNGVRAWPVAWYQGTQTLDSGWAWGQAYLDGGTAVAESKVGKGTVILLGPEVTFRGQPHATFKFLFNGLFTGSAEETTVH